MSHRKHKASKNSNKPAKNLEKPPPLRSRLELNGSRESPESVTNDETAEHATMHETPIDRYARETAAAIESLRNLFPLIPSSFFDIAQTNSIEFVRMQMRMLDLVTNQSKTYIREIDEQIERAA